MSIILIDDSRLFIKAVGVPLELFEAEVAELVDHDVETYPLWSADRISAFYKKGESLCVYVGSEKSLFEGIESDKLNKAKLIIPASALFCAFDLKGACVLLEEDSVCAVDFSEGSITKIAAVSAVDGNINVAIKNALGLAGIDCKEPSLYRFTSVKVKHGKIFADLAKLDESMKACEELSLVDKLKHFASAELRSIDMLKNAKSSLVKGFFKSVLLYSLPIIIVLMSLYQVSILWYKNELKKSAQELEKIEPQAKKIEAYSAEIAKLASFKGKKIHPIETLALINSMRADGIMFERVSQENYNSILVEGTSDSINSVKEFVDSLNSSEVFNAKMESDTSRGNTRFSIKIERR